MSTTERIPMLASGHKRLQAELKTLKHEGRPNVIKAIEEARAHGDLSENAEYHAAKEEQGHIETRITELEDALTRAEVIDPTTLSGSNVLFGATVTLIDEDDKSVIYQVVGPHEADVKAGKISNSSPLGRALIGRSIGDDVEVHTPSGEKYYEIEKIDFI
ncbi:MAG: transcription elongation factor GreA [Sphingomonadales bacterium]|nr:transcription elongation factor GreA [Sphingomonadales bacterium]